MHVSRGLSGEIPAWNCLPEISKLTLIPSSRVANLDEERPVVAATLC